MIRNLKRGEDRFRDTGGADHVADEEQEEEAEEEEEGDDDEEKGGGKG